ncbi:MAG: hypothetical protein COA88_14600 [Kordia sp.]|nr:MAG: hypothetical protein COA88_14600 [Kordia sp.]
MLYFGKKKIKIREQEDQIKELTRWGKELREEVLALIKESVMQGEHLKGDIFIPEYLGFEETVDEGSSDDVTTRIYTLADFNLSRASGKTWVLLKPNGEKHIFEIIDMYEAIMVLRCSGVPVSVKQYMNQPGLAELTEKKFTESMKQIETVKEDEE